MLKTWIKQQLTEMTAWAGFIICASVFFTPDWMTFVLGVILIAIDDEKAKAWITWAAPWLSKKVDAIDKEINQ